MPEELGIFEGILWEICKENMQDATKN